MDRVAGLEAGQRPPAPGDRLGPDLGRGEPRPQLGRDRRQPQDVHRPADQRATPGQGRRHPWMGRVVGLEHELGLGRRVRVVHLLDVDHRQHRAVPVGQGQPVRARGQRLGRDRERHRERPHVPAGEPSALHHAGVVGRAEEPGQRRERPNGQALEVGQAAAVQGHGRQPGRLGGQGLGLVGGDQPLGQAAAVRGRQRHRAAPRPGHGPLPTRVGAGAGRPSSRARTRAADASGGSTAVSSTSSGASGGS
jgi:hypothetical protein